MEKPLEIQKNIEMSTETAAPNNRLHQLGLLAFVLLLAYLSFTNVFSHALDRVSNGHIDNINRTYIKTSLKDSIELLSVLSATKAALGVLKSSSGGISFFIDVEVGLGEALNAIFDMVNYAWIFSVAAVAASTGLELLLDLSRLFMAPVLTLFFILLGFNFGLYTRFPRISASLAEMSRYILLVVLAVHFIIPLSVYVTAASGHYFFQEHNHEIRTGFESMHTTLPKNDTQSSLNSQVKQSVSHFKDKGSDIHQQTLETTRLTIKHIVLVMLEHLVAPIALFYVIFIVFHRGLEHLFKKKSAV